MLSVIVWPNERSEEPFKNKRAARHNQQGQPVSSSCTLCFLNSKQRPSSATLPTFVLTSFRTVSVADLVTVPDHVHVQRDTPE